MTPLNVSKEFLKKIKVVSYILTGEKDPSARKRAGRRTLSCLPSSGSLMKTKVNW